MEEIKDKVMDTAININSNFKEKATLPEWPNYLAISKFKSVRRAIKRGHVDLFFGVVYPSRPFNNRKPTPGRSHNQLKQKLYEQLRRI